MREIKFRAWDEGTKTMLLWKQFNLMYPLAMFTHIKDYQFEIMQYTGLKDKNGKECYWDDWVTDGINPKFLVTPDYHLLARLSEIEFEIVGNKYEME